MPATGILINLARARGYDNVNDYLVSLMSRKPSGRSPLKTINRNSDILENMESEEVKLFPVPLDLNENLKHVDTEDGQNHVDFVIESKNVNCTFDEMKGYRFNGDTDSNAVNVKQVCDMETNASVYKNDGFMDIGHTQDSEPEARMSSLLFEIFGEEEETSQWFEGFEETNEQSLIRMMLQEYEHPFEGF